MNFATVLTLYRLFMLIPFTALFFIEGVTASWIMIVLYTSACITDYFDGFVARKFNQITSFGRFLDPIADKILVGIALLMLSGTGRIHGVILIAAVIILCREILVSGLREFLATIKVRVPVTYLAKWKTGIQMLAIGCLQVIDERVLVLHTLGEGLLILAALLTLVTGYDYLKAGLRHMSLDAA